VRDPRERGARPSATTRANYKRADSLALLTHVRGRATPNRSAVVALRVLKVPKIGRGNPKREICQNRRVPRATSSQ